MKEKQLFQYVVGIAACVPVAGGLYGILAGTDADIDLDSHYRYMSGILLAIGLAYWSCIPRIEDMAARIRLLTVLVVAGGIGRLYGVIDEGAPSIPMRLALSMELVVTPLICLWHIHIKKAAQKGPLYDPLP